MPHQKTLSAREREQRAINLERLLASARFLLEEGEPESVRCALRLADRQYAFLLRYATSEEELDACSRWAKKIRDLWREAEEREEQVL